MSDKAIIVSGIGKAYRIWRTNRGELHTGPILLENSAESSKALGFGHLNVFRQRQKSTFWALRDLDFEIAQGEAVGIIGRNGAGKSTLLKILSRITRPTTGSFSIDGRVSSLLEVGTGFHPELTGRENIYLNGTILGMKRREVKSKFDEIIAFSGVEDFIDTPVKHYSSGMKVRLAFSVAAYLEPEILIIDEVLAVGDAEFQRKCLGKMEDVAGEGRTVLFVSHNMGAVERLCRSALLLANGKISFIGETSEVISKYLLSTSQKNTGVIRWEEGEKCAKNVELLSVSLIQNNEPGTTFTSSKPLSISVEYALKQREKLSIGIQLFTNLDVPVFSTVNWKSCSINDPLTEKILESGKYVSTCIIPASFLNEENYKIHVVLVTKGNKVLMSEKDILNFSIINDGHMRSNFHEKWIGVIRPKLEWNTKIITRLES